MKKSTFLIIAVFVSGMFFTNLLKSQEESPISVNLDLYSRYVWRGTDFGSSPSLQPGFKFSKSGFTAGVWGAYTTNINNPAQEADIYLGYTFLNDMLSLTVTDYFFPTDGAENSYFKYDNTTTHVFETSLAFNGTENLPLSFLVGTLVYGNDKDRNGDNRFSTYCEIKYSPEIKGMPFSVFCGLNLIAPADEDLNLPVPVNGFYGNELGVVNFGVSATKKIKVTESFEIPLNVSVITNPMKGNLFLVAGLSF
jgi:uncharacterized protein (TIGR02001 family)